MWKFVQHCHQMVKRRNCSVIYFVVFKIYMSWYIFNCRLKYGFVYLSNEKRFPISNIHLLQSDNNNNSHIGIKIKANRKIYRMSFSLKKDLTLKSLNEHTFGYQLSNISADCKINDFSGKATVECWYEYKGKDLGIIKRKLLHFKSIMENIFFSNIFI